MPAPAVTIASEGKALDPVTVVLSVEVKRALNRVPEATVLLLAGSSALKPFQLSDLPAFELGKKVRISLRNMGDPKDTPVFEGLVVRHAVESGPEGHILRVLLKDQAFLLTRARRTALYRDTTDSQVFRQLISAAGCAPGDVADTGLKHPELVQYNATSWDFLVSRADALGLVVSSHLGRISAVAVALGLAKRTLNHGLGDLRELELELDGAAPWGSASAVGWDPSARKATGPQAGTAPLLKVGKVDADGAGTIGESLGAAELLLQHPVAAPAEELLAWAGARLSRSRYALLRGRVVIAGDAALAPLDAVQILGVGERFNGLALVSGVTHRVDAAGWTTALELGLAPESFALQPDIADMPAGGLLPPARGLQVGTVGAFEKDPTGELRVRVSLPTLQVSGKPGFVWARLAQPDAGPRRGFTFRPEEGDEVIIGFLDEDPRQAVVLGALHSAGQKPPALLEQPDAKNPLRAIVSRSGARIVFDDDKPSLTLEVTADGDGKGPYKNRICLDQKGKKISVEDEHGNVLSMDKDGILLKSAKNVTIDAPGGDVVFNCKSFDIK